MATERSSTSARLTALATLAALVGAFVASGCSEDAEAARAKPLPPVQGAALDAPLPEPEPEPAEPEQPAVPAPRDADTVPAPTEESGTHGTSDLAGAEPPSALEASDSEKATSEPVTPEPVAPEPASSGGTLAITFGDLALEDEIREDLLDALIYPEEYSEEERTFPADVARLDGKHVSITGYMIPVLWRETKVTEFMLVGDLLACCFGGAPEPDQWIEVTMAGKYEAEYYPFVPVVVTGVFRIAGIADDAGYAAGAYHLAAESVQKEL